MSATEETEPAGPQARTQGLQSYIARTGAAIDRHPVLTRTILAGPGALLVAFVFLAGMPVWVPVGAAGVDNIVFPLVLAPLFWAVAFTYSCIEENLARGTAVMSAVLLANAALIATALAG